ncbi:SH3 domain-containing protein [Rivularia sp. PCC 7116]|nr:SH3 domain-containing protein [Rivularia sp. PCC 7116]
MKFVAIIFFSFGVLLILFGISISTPFLSWAGKRFNSSNSNSVNYKQPSSIRMTSMLMGISFFIFGLFITIASATLISFWNEPSDDTSLRKSVPHSVPATPKSFSNPMVERKKSSIPSIKYEKKSFAGEYGLDCPESANGLNMRKQAGLNTEITTVIPCDAIGIKDKQQRYYRDGVEWYLVEYQQKIGWVAGKYLKQQANKPSKINKSSQRLAKKRP